jgi:plasmid maintenance system killer protein
MKLVMLDQVEALSDLDQPGNDLKKIGARYQIRLNNQYRIRFKWEDGDVDYVVVGEFHDD